VALVKGVPLSAAVAEAAAAALLRAALDEEDSESPRSISLGRMLRHDYARVLVHCSLLNVSSRLRKSVCVCQIA